uniref:Uncharacterized protein n=1 Tax=Anopheles farauti TaxID=69004 RepID=A0A182QHY1_9DIPT
MASASNFSVRPPARSERRKSDRTDRTARSIFGTSCAKTVHNGVAGPRIRMPVTDAKFAPAPKCVRADNPRGKAIVAVVDVVAMVITTTVVIELDAGLILSTVVMTGTLPLGLGIAGSDSDYISTFRRLRMFQPFVRVPRTDTVSGGSRSNGPNSERLHFVSISSGRLASTAHNYLDRWNGNTTIIDINTSNGGIVVAHGIGDCFFCFSQLLSCISSTLFSTLRHGNVVLAFDGNVVLTPLGSSAVVCTTTCGLTTARLPHCSCTAGTTSIASTAGDGFVSIATIGARSTIRLPLYDG